MSDLQKESSASIELVTENHLRVSGELGFSTVTALETKSRNLFMNANNLEIDFAGVSRADSAGVALLVEWQRQAQNQKISIDFINIPSQMLDIARLSGVDDLLSLNS